jgi:hypothetical protein
LVPGQCVGKHGRQEGTGVGGVGQRRKKDVQVLAGSEELRPRGCHGCKEGSLRVDLGTRGSLASKTPCKLCVDQIERLNLVLDARHGTIIADRFGFSGYVGGGQATPWGTPDGY